MSYLPADPSATPALASPGPGEGPASGSVPFGPPTVLLVTGSTALRDQVQLAAATVGVGVRTDPASGVDPLWWARAGLVLLGADVPIQDLPGPRPGLVVLGDATVLPPEGLDAELVRLPEGRPRLEALLAGGEPPTGLVIGVIGALGGVGASTLAVALALSATQVLLVDADPLGPGLQTGLGWDDLPGARWPELDAARGRVRPEALREALPSEHGRWLLSYDRGSPAVPSGPRAVRLLDVLTAARRVFPVVVVDLPRRAEAADLLVWRALDTALVVTRAGVGGTLAAARLTEALRALSAQVAVVIRPQPGGFDITQIADVLRVQRVLPWSEQRGLAAAQEAGDLERALAHGRTGRLAADLLAWAAA